LTTLKWSTSQNSNRDGPVRAARTSERELEPVEEDHPIRKTPFSEFVASPWYFEAFARRPCVR